MNMTSHDDIRIKDQTFMFDAVIKTIDQYLTTLLPGKNINPSYNGKCHKIGGILIGDLITSLTHGLNIMAKCFQSTGLYLVNTNVLCKYRVEKIVMQVSLDGND